MTEDATTIERDLAAVEAALRTRSASHPDEEARDLQELALTLAAEAPPPRPEFAERLGKRVDEGFPRPPRAVRRARRASRGGTPLLRELGHGFAPLAAVVATIALVVALPLVFAGGSDDHGDAAGGAGGGGAAESAAGGGRGADASSGEALVAPAPRGEGFAPGQPNRRIERTFSMDLAVPVDEMTKVADEVASVAYRHGGFVLSSSVDSGDDGGQGDFSLRIPTAELRPALRDLAALAPVTHQSQEGRDVTRRHVTAKDRLQAARAERRSLLRRLAEADTDEEAEAIRRRLDLVAGEINGLRAQLRDLRLRTNYAVVNVTLSEARKDGGELGSFGDSLDDAGNLLAGFAGVTIRALALALPLGAIALLAWLAARGMRRRRRESALV